MLLISSRLPERYQPALFFYLSCIGLYFTLVNLPSIHEQADAATSAAAPIIGNVFIWTAPVLFVVTGASALATKYWPHTHLVSALSHLATVLMWWATLLTPAIFLAGITLHLTTGNTLISVANNIHSAEPYPLLTIVISLMYALGLGWPYIRTLIVTEIALSAVGSIFAGSDPLLSLADHGYALIFSFIIVGAVNVLLSALTDLDAAAQASASERLRTFELEEKIAENTRANALLHDHIIAVTVVVGKALEVPHQALQHAAKNALRVLDDLCNANSLTPEVPVYGSPTPGTSATRSTSALSGGSPRDSVDISVTDLYSYARTAATGADFTFSCSGITHLLFKGRSSLLHRLRRYYVSQHAASGLIDAMGEAMRNTQRHSKAAHKSVNFYTRIWGEPCVIVTVCDDGDGFQSTAHNLGFGLRESVLGRLRKVGGHATIRSAPGQGCSVRLGVPLHRRAPQPFPSARLRQKLALTCGPGRALEDYLRTRRAHFTIAYLIPLLWLHAFVSTRVVTDPNIVFLCGVTLTVFFTYMTLYPAAQPTTPFCLAITIASALLPALTITVLPTGQYPGISTFVVPFLVFIHLWLWIRGAYITAITAFCITLISFGATSFAYPVPAPTPWDVIQRNIGTMVSFLVYTLVQGWIHGRIQHKTESRDFLREVQAARSRVLIERKKRAREIDSEVRDLLIALASGADPEPLRTAAAIREEQLRDSIRATHLCVSPLREAIRQARTRGATVRLADDSHGETDLRELIQFATNVVIEAQSTDVITIRALPPDQNHSGTVLITDAAGTVHLTKV